MGAKFQITPPGKAYRLLKVVTQPATPEQATRLGNDRAPVVLPPAAPADKVKPVYLCSFIAVVLASLVVPKAD